MVRPALYQGTALAMDSVGINRREHASNAETQEWLKTVVRGYFQYHALPDNQRRMRQFRGDVLRDIPGLVSGLRPDIRGRNRVR